jgi:hypothetical protein
VVVERSVECAAQNPVNVDVDSHRVVRWDCAQYAHPELIVGESQPLGMPYS